MSNTLGGLLKKARLSKELDLKEVSKQISIESKYLESLETDDYYKLPSPTYARGFLKRYAEFLKLDFEKILEQWDEKYNHQERELKKPKSKIKKMFQLSQFKFKIILILVLFCLILFYLGFGIKNILFSPEIEIFYPAEDMVTTNSSLTIKGKIDPRAAIFINNQPVEQTDEGLFEQKIDLLIGLNQIEISAKKKYSKEKIIYRQIVLEKEIIK
ncbi:helix-turn-helix domain-containing protein [Patescibacteria group bacterium]|nr:helix-turn-helix domain-containing protein [Patescibacteria group bacterium]